MSKTLQQVSPRIRETYKRAQEALQKNNTAYAIDLLLSVLELEPELHEVRTELREVQMEAVKGKKSNSSLSGLKGMGKKMAVQGAIKKDPAKALPLAEELLKIDLTNPAFHDVYIEAAKASNNVGAAAVTLATILKYDRKNDKLLEKLGHLYIELGDSQKARETFEKLGELRPGDQSVIKWIKDTAAMDTMRVGNWEAEGDFRGKLKDEDEAAALEQASRAQLVGSDLQRMIDTQRKKLEAEPDNLNLYRPLADSLVKAELFDEALEVLGRADEKANHADPVIQRSISAVTVQIYQHNIKVLKGEGDLEGAKAQEEEMNAYLLEDAANKVARYPNDLGFKFDYGKLLMQHGDLDKAIAQFQQAQRNPQRRIDALYYMGSCFKTKGQYDIAAAQLSKAAEELPSMDDKKISILYELGEVLEAQGKYDAALEHFKQIYSVDIGYRDVAQKIEDGYKRAKSE
jgi:tetratricopeptide (TPR) repeat protein